MSTPDDTADGAPRLGERALGRGVTATWWYTATAIVFFGAITYLAWVGWVPVHFDDVARRVWAGLGATALLVFGSIVLLHDYRPGVLARRDDERRRVRPADLVGLGAMVIAAPVIGLVTGSWLAGASAFAFALSVRAWPRGIRWRVVLGLTAILIALWVVEAPSLSSGGSPVYVPALFTVLLPVTCASSMWWWEIVIELDRAREAESALAATRERLRLANDVHDLQGHHLQVIALQLELAERLMQRGDPDGASREIARARVAVDAARQGTRDLASQFRGVPLPDELENAADLLRSAGLEVDTNVDAGAVGAPADVLGPIVRESVTNVLKHGGGHRASLSLVRADESWVYRIANDDPGRDDVAQGSGLEGMSARAEAVGGGVEVTRDGTTFALTISLPADAASTDRKGLA